jgi:DNA-binding NarL/FixJ family response regulator
VKSRSPNSSQKARIEIFARQFGKSPEEIRAIVINLGLSLLEQRLSQNSNQQLPEISSQQGTVLTLLQQGKTVKEIAYHLRLGEATVRTHIKRLKDKLGCNDLLNLRMKDISKMES